ncbi:uncharacterized protein LOC128202196 [Galleria mellonella]|uniref:Uncharacterized protein LOC128202196 n=1 Tax=Galleria mellonella TaxID=7137 RepID=A0ABM3N1T8_GALME|nr:uncharacterized protein LOC128202196 [Galleria mellonella]
MVGKICTVCKNCSYLNRHLSFFTYPGDPERRYEWLKAVDRLDLLDKLDNNKTRGNHRICEAHFEDKYVRRSVVCEGRKFLTKNAFPTLRLESPHTVRYNNFVNPPDLLSDSYNEYHPVLQLNHFESYEMPTVSERSTPSPPPCTDLSEFCESVIKVSKGTQTPDSNRRKIEYETDLSTKKRKIEMSGTNSLFIQMCDKFLPKGMSTYIKWHLSSDKNVNRVNLMSLFSINLYYSSPNSYEMLRNMLSLPTVDDLKYFLVPKTTRLSSDLLKAMKSKVNCMSENEKICSISVSSMFLKPNLYYDIKSDRIIGLHDVDGNQSIKLAKYGIVLMAQGIVEDWIQPIAYSFISDYDYYPEVSVWIDDMIAALIDIGLDVRTFVSDPRSEFLYASESRSVTPDKPYFLLNNRNIFYIYDTLQLLRVIRNNLKSCDFYHNGETTGSVDTMDFCKMLNDLCSFLNAESPHQSAYTNTQVQANFMENMVSIFQTLKVVRKFDGADVTQNMKFIEGFQITINSVMQLYHDLNSIGISFLKTNRLNHNKVHIFFKKVKQLGGKDECTARDFNKCFVRKFVGNMLLRPLGSKKYSLATSFEMEKFSDELFNTDDCKESDENVNKPLKIFTTDYRIGLPDKNAFVYVCGYCYLKCLEHHCCDKLKVYLKHYRAMSDDEEESRLCSVRLQINVKNCKILPPDSFTEFLMLLENKFKEYFQSHLQITSIGQEILKELKMYSFDSPCPCFPIDYLKMLFVRVRLFYTIRKNNKSFRRKKGPKLFRVYSL